MKRTALLILCAAAAIFSRAGEAMSSADVVANKEAGSVRFFAKATGVREGDPVEFLAIGPLSDRDYESLLITRASPEKIMRAFEEAGIPRGIPCDAFNARLWPFGEKLSVSIENCKTKETGDLKLLLKDLREKDEGEILSRRVVYTGGLRDANGALVAATNIPCAVFALYNHSPSMLQLDGSMDQSQNYGRFVSAAQFDTNALFEVTVSWNGKTSVRDEVIKVTAQNAADEMGRLRKLSEAFDVHVRPAFDDGVKVREAKAICEGFAQIDGSAVKMNGAAEGQFYYRAFLPREEWRDRTKRMFQPFEVHVDENGGKTFVFCREDWKVEGTDPAIIPQSTQFKDWSELSALIAKTGESGEKIMVMFLYAPGDAEVGKLLPAIKAVGKRINTFYVFEENR